MLASVDDPVRLVPGVANRLSLHVPAPGDRRSYAHEVPRPDHPCPFDRPLGSPVYADAPCDERVERDHVVDNECHVGVPSEDVTELPSLEDRCSGSPDPEIRAIEFQRDRDHVGLPFGRTRRESRQWLRLKVGNLLWGESHRGPFIRKCRINQSVVRDRYKIANYRILAPRSKRSEAKTTEHRV